MSKKKKLKLWLTPCGGYRQVQGSCTLIQFINPQGKKKSVLFDCGSEMEGSVKDFLFDPKKIDAIILTHSHDDHIGLTPLMSKLGYKGNFYALKPAVDLMGTMLMDSADLRQREADIENARRREKYNKEKEIYKTNRELKGKGKKDITKQPKFKKKRQESFVRVKPLFDRRDVQKVIDASIGLQHSQWIEIFEGLEIKLLPNDHISGGASILARFSNGFETITIADSGDLGSGHSPILKQWEREIDFDVQYVISETTNVARRQPDRAEAEKIYKELVLSPGKKITVTFSQDRAQQAKYLVCQAENETGIDTNTFIDAPLAVNVTYTYMNYPEYLNDNIVSIEDAFGINRFKICASVEASKALDKYDQHHDLHIISTGGMLQGGRVIYHGAAYLGDPNATFIFIGYQAEGTLGRKLVDGCRKVTILGQEINVMARIIYIPDFSGHADVDGIYEYLNLYPNAKANLFKHGEEKNTLKFAKDNERLRGIKSLAPSVGEVYELTTEGIRCIAENQKEKAS